MRLTGIVLLLLGLSVGIGLAAPLVLRATDLDLGRTMGQYMLSAHNVHFGSQQDSEDRRTLMRMVQSTKVPEYAFAIIPIPLARDSKGKVTSQMVVLMVISELKVPDDKRGAVLEAMNKLNEANDYTHLYIDGDGDVAFRWALVVTASGLPAESVWNAYAGMLSAWETAGAELNKVIGK